VTFGEFELVSLSDGTFRLDGGAMFGVVPKVLWQRRTTPDEKNRIPMGMRPLLIRTGSQNVIIDAGIGDKLGPKETEIYGVDRGTMHLDLSLAAAGLTARDIDVVIASHLHFDHAGGFTALVDNVLVPRFPRATYYIRRGEWEDATHPNERTRASYLAENYVPLLQAGVVRFIEEDGDVLPGISVQRTGGHNMWHQIIRIVSGGRTAIFAADLLPTTAHLDETWIMGYDLYPLDTLAFKKQFLPEAIRGEYVIFFEHDPAIAAGVIRLDGTRKRVEPYES
jgi:glyoxylase-like metal-dependent hydrolase (beta-lactamase superfamily II)